MFAARPYAYTSAPPGFPSVPFNGPPPKPPHIRANVQDWQNGSWAINPAFNASSWSLNSTGSSAVSASVWMPSFAWTAPGQRQADWQAQQQAQMAAAAYNPYKRVPRPPSAEYLASKLSDNPLGLTNMIPRESLFGPKQDGMAAPTPWVWNPRTLEGEDNKDDPTQPQPEQASAPPIYARPAQMRDNSDPTPRPHASSSTTTPVRHSSEPPADMRSSLDNTPERPRGQQHFSTSREYQPTFSTNIVRTPDHYRAGNRSSSAGPSPPPQPIYGPPAGQTRRSSLETEPMLMSRMERLSVSNNTTPTKTNALSRHSSLPVPLSAPPTTTSMSMTGVSNFVEEPSTLLSPLNALRPLGPSSSLNTIPEGAFDNHATRRSLSPKRKSKRRSSRHTSPVPPDNVATVFGMPVNGYPARVSPPEQQSVTPPYNITPPNALNPPLSSHNNITPPRIHQQGQYLTPPHSATSQSYPSPLYSNPLPAPPQEPVSRDPSLRLPVQRPAPAHYRARVRKGMYNRRGDHLTMDGYIVYAPAYAAYPDELKEYPAQNVGYRDHLGDELPYMDRPELPDSLPRHGQPPMQPYEKFVVYEYLQ